MIAVYRRIVYSGAGCSAPAHYGCRVGRWAARTRSATSRRPLIAFRRFRVPSRPSAQRQAARDHLKAGSKCPVLGADQASFKGAAIALAPLPSLNRLGASKQPELTEQAALSHALRAVR